MKNFIICLILIPIIIACPFMYAFVNPHLADNQINTLIVLLIICGASALYCFIVGEISKNNSQMDKLWSILPIAYTWVIAGMGNMNPRLVIMAILVTLWGIRLTINFARKGAYSIKFWSGEEDYRWTILRDQRDTFKPRWKWSLFNLFFISIYQNVLVLLITLPALACMNSTKDLGWLDYVAIVLTLAAIIYEAIADEQQYKFQTTKWNMIKSGKKLEELPYPYNKGFNTKGLWARSRHPNYLGEQCTWIFLYLFSISALGASNSFNWSLLGAALLVLLFLGSSALSEKISSSKYDEYKLYCKKVNKFIPFKKYDD